MLNSRLMGLVYVRVFCAYTIARSSFPHCAKLAIYQVAQNLMALSPAVDVAVRSFLSLPTAIATIYCAVGDRRIARSDFGFAIVDWASYMVSIEPYIRRGLALRDIELQARRILDLCAWLGHWLYSIGFRQSRAVAKKHTIRSLRFPYLWLSKKYARFEVKLESIKAEGERLKQILIEYAVRGPCADCFRKELLCVNDRSVRLAQHRPFPKIKVISGLQRCLAARRLRYQVND